MGYSINPGVVQGLLFTRRPESEGFSGKWQYNIALDMSEYYNTPGGPTDAVLAAWVAGEYSGVAESNRDADLARGYWLVVPNPYHKHDYPVMVAV